MCVFGLLLRNYHKVYFTLRKALVHFHVWTRAIRYRYELCFIFPRLFDKAEPGPVEIPRGKIIGNRYKVLKKLGEGGCGAVYKVEDINTKELAALKAEYNNVAGGSVLKLEVQILKRLAGRAYVAQLYHSGKKENYSYMVMTLLGESLNYLIKKRGGASSVGTQVRVGINVLHGIKQIHEIGFVHRDLKPANIAVGRKGTPEIRFLHILDFGLAREFVVAAPEGGGLRMRRPRSKALFRGTTRYCSINTHERLEQGRCDDLWSLFYMLAEMRTKLPWADSRDKKEVHEMKKRTDISLILEDSPIQLLQFAEHLLTLNYYNRPDYLLLFNLLNGVMEAGQYKFHEPYDWEKNLMKSAEKTGCSKEKTEQPRLPSRETPEKTGGGSKDVPSRELTCGAESTMVPMIAVPRNPDMYNEDRAFPAEVFAIDELGF